jgi:hypothetical protein
MAGLPTLTVKKYFGNASIEQMEFNLTEAKDHLGYFWTKDGSTNVTISVDGQQIGSYDELTALVNQERYKNKSYIEVGLFLSNDGHNSIWPQ